MIDSTQGRSNPYLPSDEPVTPRRNSRVQFSGKASEFFGIWIVNILLSILTLGIYSAWAKVRTNQYIFGHLKIEGHSLNYLATPMQILKGRLIAVAIFALIAVLSQISPLFAIGFALVFIFITPWLIVQGLKFNLRMTSYRNVRFGFHGQYAGALWNCLMLPLLSVFTLYLMLPLALQRADKFIFSHISFAGKTMAVDTDSGVYFGAAIKAFVAAMAVALVGLLATVAIVGILALADIAQSSLVKTILTFVGYIGMYAGIGALSNAIYKATVRNHLLNNAEFKQLASFKSDLAVKDLFVVTATNYLAIICSLGLAYPWAKIRMTKLLADATELSLDPAVDHLCDPLTQSSSVFAEEAADVFDVDFSLT